MLKTWQEYGKLENNKYDKIDNNDKGPLKQSLILAQAIQN